MSGTSDVLPVGERDRGDTRSATSSDREEVVPSLGVDELAELESPTRCTQADAGYADDKDYVLASWQNILESVFAPEFSHARAFLGEIVAVGDETTMDLLPPIEELEARQDDGSEIPSIPLDLLPVTYRVVDALGDPNLPETLVAAVRYVDPATVRGCGRDLPVIGSTEFVGVVTESTAPVSEADAVNIVLLRVGIDNGQANALVPLNYENAAITTLDNVPISDIITQAVELHGRATPPQLNTDD